MVWSQSSSAQAALKISQEQVGWWQLYSSLCYVDEKGCSAPGAVPALHHMPGHRAWALCAAIAEGAEVWHKASRLYAAFLLLPGAGEVGRGDHPSRVPGREGCTAPLQSSSLSLQMLALTQTSGRAGLGFVVPVLRVGERLLLQPTTKSHRSHSSPASPECRKHYNSKSLATKAPKTVLHPSHISDPVLQSSSWGPQADNPRPWLWRLRAASPGGTFPHSHPQGAGPGPSHLFLLGLRAGCAWRRASLKHC